MNNIDLLGVSPRPPSAHSPPAAIVSQTWFHEGSFTSPSLYGTSSYQISAIRLCIFVWKCKYRFRTDIYFIKDSNKNEWNILSGKIRLCHFPALSRKSRQSVFPFWHKTGRKSRNFFYIIWLTHEDFLIFFGTERFTTHPIILYP